MRFIASLLILGLAVQPPAFAAKAAKPKTPVASDPVEIELAHNLGVLGSERLEAVIERFNGAHAGGRVKLARLEAGAKPAPLNLVRRYDMADVLYAPGRFVPLYKMMAGAREPFTFKELSPDLRAGVTDDQGRLVALPVAYSTPVLFYDKNAFRKAKLDPDQPPKTWFEMQGMLDKLQDAGYDCPYTSSWPTWVHVDNVSALSGAPAVSDKGQLTFNGLPQVKHIAMMATWTKANYFKLFGRRAEANKKFESGECAMITTDSWEHTEFREARGVELGVAPLPHHDDLYGGRQNTLADGASIWVGNGYGKAEYQVAARFIAFLVRPDVQIELVRAYGQLPLTQAARAALRSKVLRDREQSLEVAYASLQGNGGRPSLRVANMDPVRMIIDEELESVWADRKPAKAALDTAVMRASAVLGAKPALKKAQPF